MFQNQCEIWHTSCYSNFKIGVQNKVADYDLQIWERSVMRKELLEKLTVEGSRKSPVPEHLIDLDLVQGNSFPKAKPINDGAPWRPWCQGVRCAVFMLWGFNSFELLIGIISDLRCHKSRSRHRVPLVNISGDSSSLRLLCLVIARFEIFVKIPLKPIHALWWAERTSTVFTVSLFLVWFIQSIGLSCFLTSSGDHQVPLSEVIIPIIASILLSVLHCHIAQTQAQE